jgi:hypothetical protein
MIIMNPAFNFYTILLDAVEYEENDSDVSEQSHNLRTLILTMVSEPGASSLQPFWPIQVTNTISSST